MLRRRFGAWATRALLRTGELANHGGGPARGSEILNAINNDYWVIPSNSLVERERERERERIGEIRKIGKNEGNVVTKRSREDPLVLGVVKHFGLDVLD